MNKTTRLLAVVLTLTAFPALAYDYTLILKNGDNPACNIVDNYAGSRVVIDRQIVELGQFTEDNGTYTYQWSDNRPVTVAIQVDLANFYVPDIWMDPDCVYAPVFDEKQTTFTQQYLEPDPSLPYTCTCSSTWGDDD